MTDYTNVKINARGNYVYYDQHADELMNGRGDNRYYYDQGVCSPQKGWQQFDTDQDAHYFGCWANKYLKETFCYCEGDRVLVVCPTKEQYHQELKHMATHFGDPPVSVIVRHKDGTVTKHYSERPT